MQKSLTCKYQRRDGRDEREREGKTDRGRESQSDRRLLSSQVL